MDTRGLEPLTPLDLFALKRRVAQYGHMGVASRAHVSLTALGRAVRGSKLAHAVRGRLERYLLAPVAWAHRDTLARCETCEACAHAVRATGRLRPPPTPPRRKPATALESVTAETLATAEAIASSVSLDTAEAIRE